MKRLIRDMQNINWGNFKIVIGDGGGGWGGGLRIVENVLIAIQKLHIVKHFASFPIKEY